MYRHLRKFWYLYTIVSGILNVVMIYIVRLAKGMDYNWGDAIANSLYGIIVGGIFFLGMTKYYLDELDRKEREGKQ